MCARSCTCIECVLLICVRVRPVQTGMFVDNLSMARFIRLFHLENPEIIANKRNRWSSMMRAVQDGSLLARPNYASTWRPYKYYHDPMPDRLQSSYADVEFEMQTITRFSKSTQFIFLAGDGLTLMRMNHLLANKPDVYIFQTPAIIPIQGSLSLFLSPPLPPWLAL